MTIEQVAAEFISRRDRVSHPDGKFDKGGRWFASSEETAACCRYIRYPSRSWPYSEMVHCRTLAHVATRFGVEDMKALRQAVKRLDAQAKEAVPA